MAELIIYRGEWISSRVPITDILVVSLPKFGPTNCANEDVEVIAHIEFHNKSNVSEFDCRGTYNVNSHLLQCRGNQKVEGFGIWNTPLITFSANVIQETMNVKLSGIFDSELLNDKGTFTAELVQEPSIEAADDIPTDANASEDDIAPLTISEPGEELKQNAHTPSQPDPLTKPALVRNPAVSQPKGSPLSTKFVQNELCRAITHLRHDED